MHVTSTDPFATAYEQFAQLELETNAHDLVIGGVHIWSALRYEIFEKLLNSAGIAGTFQTYSDAGRTGRMFYNVVLRNPFLARGPGRNVFVKWLRLEKTPHGLDDVITRPIASLLPPGMARELDLRGNISGPSRQSFSTEALSLWTAAFARPYPFTTAERDPVRELESLIQHKFRVTLELQTWMSQRIGRFSVSRNIFSKLLRKWKTRRLFLVVAYGQPALVAAAHDCGADVVELQHGMIARCHAGYDFPDRISPAYVPDAYLLFGDAWRGAARFPRSARLLVSGAPVIHKGLASIKRDAPRQDRVIFISQPAIRDQLLAFALEFAALPRSLPVLFRLHPGDDLAAAQAMVQQSGLTFQRFALSQGGERTLALQAQSRFQVGVYSTAVAEGLAAGTDTFLAPLPGWSWNRHLVEQGHVRLAQTPQMLLQLTQEAGSTALLADPDALFAPVQPGVLQALGDA